MSAIDSNMSSIVSNAMAAFDVSADKILSISRSLSGADEKDSLIQLSKGPYDYTALRDSAITKIPTSAVFKDLGTFPSDTTVSIDKDYTSNTVTAAGTELQPYKTVAEIELQTIPSVEVTTDPLVEYSGAVVGLIKNAADTLQQLSVDINLQFANMAHPVYTPLWESGFMELLRDPAAPDLTDRLYSTLDSARQTVHMLVLQSLNQRGFTLPADMLQTGLIDDTCQLSSAELLRKYRIAKVKFTAALKASGLSVERLHEEFTKSINELDVSIDKIRLAGAVAYAKGKANALTANIRGITETLQLYSKLASVPEQWLQVEEAKIRQTETSSRLWDAWTEARTSAEAIKAAINDCHFTEQAGNQQIAEESDRLDRMVSEIGGKVVTAEVGKLLAEKGTELALNDAQTAIYGAQIQVAAALMERQRTELQAYIADFTASFDKLQAEAALMTPLGDLSKNGARLLGNLLNETQITLTTLK